MFSSEIRFNGGLPWWKRNKKHTNSTHPRKWWPNDPKQTYPFSHYQLNGLGWWFGARWFGFKRDPRKWKGLIPKCAPIRIPNHQDPNHQLSIASWWFQPLWKISYSQHGNLPQIEVKIKHLWNHHLVNHRLTTKNHRKQKNKNQLPTEVSKLTSLQSHHPDGLIWLMVHAGPKQRSFL